ncbi:MAG: pantoate--beta-alanine ligase [Luminiphilus sp.]|jgi:pantoate--beta-alanine ligase|nr:pantoate--beta-alanine ligase [Luminiphilus sp.]
MNVASDIGLLHEFIASLRGRVARIAFVPTMGNLHNGHLALVNQALETADAVIVSIFVNPTQFAAHEDLDTYPRTLEADLTALESAGVDLVFTPTASEIYPEGGEVHTKIHVPKLGDELCGKDRPGHFDGVCTVIYRLFQIITPDLAIFGEKDLQQLLILEKMVSDLSLPVEIQSGATHRAEDGLALSSRNQYLSQSERAIAPTLWQTLQQCVRAISEPTAEPFQSAQLSACRSLEEAGFTVDYLELRTLSALSQTDSLIEDCALFAAARLGTTRLIDNIQIRRN